MFLRHSLFDNDICEYPQNLKVIVNATEYPHYHQKEMLVMWISISINRNNEPKKMYHLAFNGSFAWKLGICQIYLGEQQIKII